MTVRPPVSAEAATGGRAGSAGRALARVPPWMLVLGLYLASRLVSTALLATMFHVATVNGWAFASPRRDADLFTFSGSWDASFYRTIAEHGYPRELPLDADGNVLPNPWAFLPGYPWVVRGVMAVTGLGFFPAGVLVSTLCGGAAAVVLHRLVSLRARPRAAWFATALFCFGPLAFLLQTAYAESLSLLLVFASLLLFVRRRYLWSIPVVVAAAGTRPGAPALSLTLAIVLVARFLARRRDPFPWRERVAIVAAGLVTAAAGLAWPFVAGAVTGVPGAYVDTELSWWSGFVGRVGFVPLTPWFLMAGRWLGAAGILLVVAALAGAAWWLASRPVRRLGAELAGFGWSQLLFLVAVFLPQQSLFRMLLPLAPLAADERLSAGRVRPWTLLGAGLLLQPVAIVLLWFLGYP